MRTYETKGVVEMMKNKETGELINVYFVSVVEGSQDIMYEELDDDEKIM
jgi:hypothetical protein